MRKIKLIHAADLHLDSAFEAMGKKSSMRRNEQRQMLNRIASAVKTENADILLLAGDLLDTRFAYAETTKELLEVLSGLSCPIFISPGNHDYYTLSSPYARLTFPENVHIFKTSEISAVDLKSLGVTVYGAGFTDILCSPLLTGFTASKKSGFLNIGVLHGKVGSSHANYNPMTEDEIATSGLDYLALGHVHTYSGLQKAGSTYYSYSGCPEGRGFDECGEKGILCVEISEESCSVRFIETALRKYDIIGVDINDNLDEIITPRKNDIIRILLHGACEIAPDTKAISEKYKDYFYALDVKDSTTIKRDLWESSAENSLKGIFLRSMKERLDLAESDEDRDIIIAAVRWGIAALDGGEAVDSL